MITFLWLCGWAGTIGLFLFYWLLGSGKVLHAYIYGTVGAAFWLVIGIASMFGIHPTLPSLILMESVIIIMNIRGIIKWNRGQSNYEKSKKLAA